jgi:transcription antitermination protein NusB
MGTRRKSRELTMQMLFQGDLGKQTPEEVRTLFWHSRDDVDAETRGFAEDLHRVAAARQPEIDALIESHAQNWRLERMAVVDRNLLRAAVAEMLG